MRLAAPPRLALTTSLIALLATTPALAADPYVTASATITNLRYRLIDLDPTDGIAPSASFSGSGTVRIASSTSLYGTPDVDTTTPISGLDFPLPTLSQGSADFGNILAGTTIASTASAGAGNGPVLVNQFPGDGTVTLVYSQDHAQASYVSIGDQSGFFGGFKDPFNITLGANTGIVFEGTASLAVSLDTSAFLPFNTAALALVGQPSTLDEGWSYGTLQGAAGVAIGLRNYAFGTDGSLSHRETTYQLSTSLSDSVNIAGGSLTQIANAENFLVDYWNMGPDSTVVSFSIDTSANAGSSISGLYTTAVAVPEPGTWALMGLGLAGVALARRRHRA